LRRRAQLVVEPEPEDGAGAAAGAGELSVLAGALVSEEDVDDASEDDELLFDE